MRKPNYTYNEGIESKNDIYEGKSLEREIEQAETTKAPIVAEAPMIYTSRKEGVVAAYDIRADRFDLAQQAMGELAKTYQARRDDAIKAAEEPKKETQTKTQTE